MIERDPSLVLKLLDFNKIYDNNILISKLRGLTLNCYSGLNHELDSLIDLCKTKNVNASVILGFYNRKLISWALLSQEDSDFCFFKTGFGYDKNKGVLFEIFVEPSFRRKGIGTAITSLALNKINNNTLCICPWDARSNLFYLKFKQNKICEL